MSDDERRIDFQIERLELDVDCRVLDLWECAAEVDKWDLDIVATFVRAAYGRGFTDAVKDPDPDKFFLDNGYKPPKRREK